MGKLVSIVVPIYNVEKMLRRCIESILLQTYDNTEVILVDDGSTDNSGKIADEYKRTNSKINVIHKENGGLSDARNEGIKVAQGEYICFIDSDDFIHKRYVEILLNACEEKSCDIAVCDYISVDDIQAEKIDTGEEVRENSISVYNSIDMLHRLYNETYASTVVAWNKLYKRSIFENIVYPVGKIHEDEATTYKLLYKADKVAVLDSKLYFYYQNMDSITRKKYNIKRLDILTAVEERREFYKENGLEELFFEDSYKYLDKILRNYCQIFENNEIDNKKDILKELKYKYRNAYRECKKAPWSFKRRIKLVILGAFPSMYRLMLK